MKEQLAHRLLATVLGWEVEQVRDELGPLFVLAEAKYDRYQQYSPGMRFIESLAVWLQQFPDPDSRQLAFQLIRDRLIYISSEEMFHLINMTFSDHIRPVLMRIAAERAGVASYRVAQIVSSSAYREILAKSIYVGLSDGAQVGLLRRLNPGIIGHEHTLISYDTPGPGKADEMIKKHLIPSLAEIRLVNVPESERFEVLVLVDDFTASGISFFRYDDGKLKGKLARILESIKTDRYSGLLCDDEIHICLLFYVATRRAVDMLTRLGHEYLDVHMPQARLYVMAVQMLDDTVQVLPDADSSLDRLLRDHVASSCIELVDEHWLKGKHDRPHLGYDECALPLVLFHNTPNNSLPVLWFTPDTDRRSIFPRTVRHGKQ